MNKKELSVSDIKYCNKNRFVLRFPENCGLYEWMVSSVAKSDFYLLDKDKNSDILEIKMHNSQYGDIEIKELLEDFNKMEYEYLSYEDLDKTGCPLTKEYYLKPKIVLLHCEKTDYSVNELKSFTIIVKYEKVVTNIDNI